MNDAHSEHLRYAGFWVRTAACLIDMIVYTPFYFAFTWAFGGTAYLAELLFMLFALLTYAWFFSSRWQGSPGMHAMKIHIRAANGGRLTFLHALAWGVVGTAGWLLCFAGVLFLQACFNMEAINNYLATMEANHVPIDPSDPQLEALVGMPVGDYVLLVMGALALTLVLTIVWALSVALPKDKTGFHNIICRTRFVQGRP